ncbi:hypothetical protein OPQ81_000239 [Rhizoctonia solani]|nr:hypothetical protein OPQ81_000239 [Rhizoctonia solani]
MGDGFAKGTIGNYASALKSFTKFCDENNIAEELRFPTDERVLCAFLSSLNKSVSGSTAKTTLTALKRWHDMHRITWNGSERHNIMVRGITNNTPAESKRPKRPAVTTRMLMDLNSALDHNDPKDSAILACALTAFFGQARLGELLATSRLKHNPSTHPSRNSIIILLNSNAREIELPRTKTSQADGESIYLTRQSDPLDPVKALENHLHVNHSLATSDHLFAYRSSTSQTGRHSLTIEDFMRRVNDIWTCLGHQRVTGHSFRIGGTTTLLRNGVPPDVVKELGRWSSDAFHVYWRDIPEIATRHVEFLQLSMPTTVIASGNNNGQARRSLRHVNRHNGRTQLQGRPAYRPY